MSEGHLDLIARIHAGFDAQERLARSLDGRAVAVRGASPTERDQVEPDLEQCGATVVDEIVDAEALVAGPGIARCDLREAAGLRIAILRTTDVTLIATTRRRLDRQRELAYHESVGRALADARRLVAQRDRRVAAGITEPVAPGRGLHIRGGSDDSA
jgi:hypothetical protein